MADLQDPGGVDRRRARDYRGASREMEEARGRAQAFRSRLEQRSGRKIHEADGASSANPGGLISAARGQDRRESERAFKDFGSSSVSLDRPPARPT